MMQHIKRLADGFVNVAANLGTWRDKASHNAYALETMSHHTLLEIYRATWLAKNIVDYPAEDAVRKWRNWQATPDQIGLIEALEAALNLKSRTFQALVMARLYGGAAIYINTADADATQPLRVGAEIKSLVVLSRHALNPEQNVRDIDSVYYGKPEFYRINSQESQVAIHASRLVIFSGASLPVDPSISTTLGGWGDSALQATIDSVRNTDSTMANIAALVFEAKIDVFKFKGFADMLAENQDDAVIRRLQAQAAIKGINGAVTLDVEDDYQQKSASFAGLPDVVGKFQETVSGASRIPLTRLYGRSAAGLSGSGDGDERVYYDRIGFIQAVEIGPAMTLLDECLIHQALGGRPEEVFYKWNPLRQLTESERAENFAKTASAARAVAGTDAGPLIPLDALSDGLVNELIEQGVLPGLEHAIENYGTLAEQDGFVDPPPEPPQAVVGDAKPRSLYVSRKVLNGREILEHFRAQGVPNLLTAEDLHVTVTYSRSPVNWMEMGEAWQSRLTVEEGGPRVMEGFGPDGSTLVLGFLSSELNYRHERMVESGASWDWSDYQPHVTVALEFKGDPEALTPWSGKIELGPEIFEPIIDDWKAKVETT